MVSRLTVPHEGICAGLMRGLFLWISWGIVAVCSAAALPIPLIAYSNEEKPLDHISIQFAGESMSGWICDGNSGSLTFKSKEPSAIPPDGTLYLAVSYLDRGYGKLAVRFVTPGHSPHGPDRFLGLSRSNTGKMVTARMRFASISSGASRDWCFKIGVERSNGEALTIGRVSLQDSAFDDPGFKLVISDPWKGPHVAPGIRPKDNTTLKGKVMAGYQGWFRTPNDLEGRGGWQHWGDIRNGTFHIDMWPDVSQYPSSVLEKAADVKLASGKQAYLFSSTWPAVVDTHFRWMREHDIDGVFLQRFVSDSFHAISGGSEWVLSNVRAAANREGRIWAVEYDISGYPDEKLLETLKADWKWLVDEFRLFDDANYAREGGKPVVFIWGLPFPNRNISPETSNAVVEFFKNDPEYGGNHVIGGIPADWRKMNASWQAHFKKYESILTWMPPSYAADAGNFKEMGINYYPHVKPGFSWANLKHLPTGDTSLSYQARDGGEFYWNQLSKVSKAGGDRLFVGMFDEYDEATAIMPMSDDAPPTPVRSGVGATFYPGDHLQENGDFVLLPTTELKLGEAAPSRRTTTDHFFVNMGGRITFPVAGDYHFSVEGAEGDGIELFLNGRSVFHTNKFDKAVTEVHPPVTVGKGESMAFRLQCRHRTEKGTLRLLWEAPGIPRRAVDASALHDAWGRFITNEGKTPDWWLQLTRMGKEMILDKREHDLPMP